MRLVTDFMGWLAHDSAAVRARPAGAASIRRAARRPAASEHRIIRASGVTGAPVFSVSGERCGRICDLSIEKRSGRIVYALVAAEGDLGFLQRLCPVPWSLLRYDLARGGYMVPTDRADLTAGPAITAEELRHMGAGDDAWQQRLAVYYTPYLTLPFI